MLKHPPQQTTRRYASDSRRTGAFNFAQFVSLLSATGFHYDRLHSRPATRSSFSYQLRLTRTKVGTFCLMEISPSCVSGYFPRKRNTAQDVCLLFVLEGELMVTSHAESTRLAKGEVLIGDPHNLISFVAKKKVTLFYVLVSSEYFYTHAGFRTESFFGQIVSGASVVQSCFTEVLRLFCTRLDIVDARDVGDLCDGVFCFLRPVLAEFSRLHHAGLSTKGDYIRARAIEAMERYGNRPELSRAQISAAVGVSSRYLAKLFAQVGTTVMNQLMDIRLSRASVQLREAHLAGSSIAEVARNNGFASPAHFSRAFKNQFGTSPSKWRKSDV